VTVAALFVQKNGVYFGLPDVDPWDEERDARFYDGPWPVVAHPPCQLWVNFAALNFKRYGGEHNRPGNDGGCFGSAVSKLLRFGGVLEHPAESKAWAANGLPAPDGIGWQRVWRGRECDGEWVAEVWQSAYGHRARKRTWLYAVGPRTWSPPPLDGRAVPGTHQVGRQFVGPNCRGEAARKPSLSKREASRTPLAFRDYLLDIARSLPGARTEAA
jgi:hypothetical protein